MGRLLISISKADEALIRKIARQDFGGKKGSISTMVVQAVHEWIRNKQAQKRRNEAADKLRALMKEGIKLDLKGGKAYEKREEIYEDRMRRLGIG